MKKILIVEDQPHVIRVLRLALERAGFSVASALNGEDAWRQIQHAPPDALITDIEMPRMSGRDLCLRIEETFPERTFPIVIMTSRTETEYREWTRTMSRVSFLEKPLSLQNLVELLTQLLTEDRTQSETYHARISAQ